MTGEDTIVAVSSPGGRALRAIVRLSGPAALDCVRRRFRPSDPSARWDATFRVTAGELEIGSVAARVPALVYVMRAPRSYTREDVVELHVPGAPPVVDMVLDDLLADPSACPRLAGPGEFTRRAYLNGRLDLAQAEAVAAIIRAGSEAELVSAAARLGGAVSRQCAALQEQIADLRAQAEAALDFAEHDIEVIPEAEFLSRCRAVRAELAREAKAGRDELAEDGSLRAVLVGPPNAGESSLLNRLVGEERAIVHPRPGTTRDAVRASAEVGGVRFTLSDTAGLAPDLSGVEAEAGARARDLAASAHVVLLVLDVSAPLPRGALEPAGRCAPAHLVCVLNKSDSPSVLDEAALRAAGAPECAVVRTSALTGAGVEELRQVLWRAAAEGRLDGSAADCLFNARQREALRRAEGEVAEAERAVAGGMGYEFAALNLRAAADALGEVTGRVSDQDVLDRIFSRFCIGK